MAKKKLKRERLALYSMLVRNISRILHRRVLQHINATNSHALKFHLQNFPLQAGHSKWANIRHTKALKDGQKSAIFTKLARQIRLAIQDGGSPDPALNSILRSIIDEALRKNMPMATIQNSIKKSQHDKSSLKKHQVQIRYKQKVFAVCILYTENFSGLKMDMTPILKKAGASFVEAAHLFDDIGLIETSVDMSKKSSDTLQEMITDDAIECGAEDIEIIDAETGSVNFICNVIEMPAVRRSLENRGYTINNTEHVFIPNNVVKLTPEEIKAYNVFVDKLRSLPGIEDIYDNIDSAECM